MAVEKGTKYCALSVSLLNGTRITGRFHIEARTTSTIRPSDAIRETKDRFILLTDVTVENGDEARTIDAIMIPPSSIAFVELPAARWITPPLVRPETATAIVIPVLS